MYSATFKTEIRSSYDKLWDILLDEIEHPEDYSSNIQKSSVLERFAGGVLRQVSVPDAEIREKLKYDYEKKVVTSSLVGHPHIVGVITKTISKATDSEADWTLESKLEWETTDDKVDAMLKRNVTHFVMESLELVKKKAEA